MAAYPVYADLESAHCRNRLSGIERKRFQRGSAREGQPEHQGNAVNCLPGAEIFRSAEQRDCKAAFILHVDLHKLGRAAGEMQRIKALLFCKVKPCGIGRSRNMPLLVREAHKREPKH